MSLVKVEELCWDDRIQKTPSVLVVGDVSTPQFVTITNGLVEHVQASKGYHVGLVEYGGDVKTFIGMDKKNLF